jgi:hypothetical protein
MPTLIADCTKLSLEHVRHAAHLLVQLGIQQSALLSRHGRVVDQRRLRAASARRHLGGQVGSVQRAALEPAVNAVGVARQNRGGGRRLKPFNVRGRFGPKRGRVGKRSAVLALVCMNQRYGRRRRSGRRDEADCLRGAAGSNVGCGK